MQNIDLICIGKMNASYFAAGVAEYQKRLGGFCNFRIIELPEASIADKNASDRQIAKALQKEADAILASVRKGAYLVALCVEGKQNLQRRSGRPAGGACRQRSRGYRLCHRFLPRAGRPR